MVPSDAGQIILANCENVLIENLDFSNASVGISLGYLYVLLISLGGFWFSLKGGIITALIASSIFLLEINLSQGWNYRNAVIEGMAFRVFVYLANGIIIGYLSAIDKKLQERLGSLASDDELTGCLNYRATMRYLENEIERCKRYKKELTIMMIDIDHFKKINDTYGHLVGNDVLIGFANVVKNNVRTIDIVGRYGGEEFLVILPEVKIEQALVVLKRIRHRLLHTKITSSRLKESIEISLKFSAGVASFPLNGTSVKDLLAIADNVLYKAI